MGNIKIKVTNLDNNNTFVTDDFYWFEEEGISEIKSDGFAKGVSGDYKIEFININKKVFGR